MELKEPSSSPRSYQQQARGAQHSKEAQIISDLFSRFDRSRYAPRPATVLKAPNRSGGCNCPHVERYALLAYFHIPPALFFTPAHHPPDTDPHAHPARIYRVECACTGGGTRFRPCASALRVSARRGVVLTKRFYATRMSDAASVALRGVP